MRRRQQINRRQFLRGAGVTLALPLLDSLCSVSARQPDAELSRRMLLISNNLVVLPKPFFPEGTGRDYELSPYLADLAEFREDFTVISGLSHPDVDGGHSTENCFLTAARGPTKSGFRNTISLDQFAADLWLGNNAIQREGYSTDLITEDAIAFIETHHKEGFREWLWR